MTVPPSPTRRQIAAEFHSPDSACRWMCSINGPHRLLVPQPRALNFRHRGTRLGNVAIGVIEYATPVQIDIADLTHSYSISLPLQGSQSFELSGDAFGSDAGVAAIISPNQPLHLRMDEQCQKRLVRLSRQAIEGKLAQLLRRDLPRPVIFDPRMPLSGTVQEWWRMVANLQEMLDAEGSLCDLPEVWGNFENSLITSLLYTQPHNYSSELLDRQQGEVALGALTLVPEHAGHHHGRRRDAAERRIENGVPYGAEAVLTEYFETVAAPNGDELLVVTTIVEDP